MSMLLPDWQHKPPAEARSKVVCQGAIHNVGVARQHVDPSTFLTCSVAAYNAADYIRVAVKRPTPPP